MTNLQSQNSNRIFDNKLAVTSGNGSSFNTGLFTESRRTGGAECFPKKNTAPVCADYAAATNRGLWCSVHRLQEPAPNCRSLLRDGGQTLNWVGDNGSPAPHSKYSAKLLIGYLALSISKFQIQPSVATKKPNRLAGQLGLHILMLPLLPGQLFYISKSPQTAENIGDFINAYCKIQVTLTPEFVWYL